MSGSLAGLLAANALYLVIGTALMAVAGIARTRVQLVGRLGLSYAVGLAASGILAAHLALVNVALDLTRLAVVAALLSVAGWLRLRGRPAGERRARTAGRSAWLSAFVGGEALVAAGVLLVLAIRAFAVRPLIEWDGWAIWAMKARALYEFGGTDSPVFTTGSYAPLEHPLYLSALEATGFRAMGAPDGTLIHLQLALLAVGFAAALWTLLHERVPAALAGAAIFAIVAAPHVLRLLASNQADMPLAFLVALGVVTLARWLDEGDRSLLVPAALFLGAAMLVKPEGRLFAAAAIVAALAFGGRARLRGTLLAAAGAFAIVLPWRIFVAVHGLGNAEYRLSDAFDPGYLAGRAERLQPAVERILDELSSGGWGLLVPLALVGLAGALLAGRWRLAGFCVAWFALSLGGILLIFWISVVPIDLTLSWVAYRIVASLVVGAAALAPLLANAAWLSARDEVGAAVSARTWLAGARVRARGSDR